MRAPSVSDAAAMVSIHTQNGAPVAGPMILARSFLRRFTGLLLHRRLPQTEGLLLQPGGSIHTIGMRFAIDVLFLDADFVILKISDRIRPLRVARAPRGTCAVLELAAGRAAACALKPGMRLKLREDC